jgi:hypothetical protein
MEQRDRLGAGGPNGILGQEGVVDQQARLERGEEAQQ